MTLETQPPAPRPVPEPAATIVLLRPASGGAEVLLIHRPASMAFGPGLHVFPGGRVDPGDFDEAVGLQDTGAGLQRQTADAAAASLGHNVPPREALAIHVAAVRELFEEAGVRLPIDALAPIAHWTTPTFMPRRFSTWFFVADLPPDAELSFAVDEVAAHRWVTARTALDQMAAGEIDMWVPTTSVLQRLIEVEAGSAADVRRAIRLTTIRGARIVDDQADAVVLESDCGGGLPGRTATTMIVGRRDLVVVDPGDPTEGAIDLILETVARRRGVVRAIVLTDPGPDRAAGAEALAIPLEVPILAAPGAGRVLPYQPVDVEAGEALPTDVDIRVRLGSPGSGRLDLVIGVSAAATPPGSG